MRGFEHGSSFQYTPFPAGSHPSAQEDASACPTNRNPWATCGLLGFHLGSGTKSLTHRVAAIRTLCSCTRVSSVDAGSTGGED